MNATSPYGLRIATKRDVPSLARVLAGAFASDPFVRWMLGDRADDSAQRARLYRAILAQNVPYGQVVVHEGEGAVAVFRPPARAQMTVLEEIAMLGTVVRTMGARRFSALVPHLRAIAKRHPTGAFAQLVVVGVEPASQGRGLASVLLRPMLRHWDSEGISGYLETSNAKNLPLYERFGFAVTSTMTIPDGPQVWFMSRPPAGNTHAGST